MRNWRRRSRGSRHPRPACRGATAQKAASWTFSGGSAAATWRLRSQSGMEAASSPSASTADPRAKWFTNAPSPCRASVAEAGPGRPGAPHNSGQPASEGRQVRLSPGEPFAQAIPSGSVTPLMTPVTLRSLSSTTAISLPPLTATKARWPAGSMRIPAAAAPRFSRLTIGVGAGIQNEQIIGAAHGPLPRRPQSRDEHIPAIGREFQPVRVLDRNGKGLGRPPVRHVDRP